MNKMVLKILKKREPSRLKNDLIHDDGTLNDILYKILSRTVFKFFFIELLSKI